MRLPTCILVTATLTLVPLTAARGQVPTLDRVDSLVTAGQYDTARVILDQWWSARDEFDVPGSDMSRALMLRAQLAPDLETAEPDYLSIVLGYPTSDYAPEALLRLGQGLLAEGDATRASAYLERLVADYPGRPQRTKALLWLARANTAARRPGAACSAAQEGLRATNDPDLRAMLQVEAAASCAVRTGAAPGERPETRPETRPERAPSANAPRETAPAAQPPAERPAAAAGEFAVQTGAFRYRESAETLMERLREAGHQPRLVRIPRNDLLRVRVGRFADRDPADALVTALRNSGFDALVVSDADEEQEP